MSLAPGVRLGAYEVLSLIGSGGMGEVYRARDSKLNRDVALKVLPEQFALDADRLARFTREAQVLASLNHPNIAAIYGLEESNGVQALVLELVEGPTLAEVLAQGSRLKAQGPARRDSGPGPKSSALSPEALDEVLSIARQICEALEAAHEHGIIHRDLKPANIKLKVRGAPPPRTEDIFTSRGDPTPARAAGARLERRLSAADVADCTVKVLDFGLAKITQDVGRVLPSGPAGVAGSKEQDPAYVLSQSPTITTPAATRLGVIMGTAAYMSPEQAKGRPLDKRTDIWAFGCVLFEMLTGRRAFEGDDVSDTLAAILRGEPDWTALPANTPPSILRLLRRCLARDGTHRLHSAADARIEIDETLTGPRAEPVLASAARQPSPWRRVATLAIALLLGGALSGVAVWLATRSAPPRVARLTITPPSTAALTLSGVTRALAISPDGARLVYVGGNGQLFVRALNQLEATPLAGLGNPRHPFLSPDGEWIGFFDGPNLKKVAISGGPAVTLCPLDGAPRGASWGADDTIIFATLNASSGLWRVSAAGGDPTVLTTPNRARGERAHFWPEVLPDGQGVLFTIVPTGPIENAQVAVLDLRTGMQKILVRGGSHAHYVPSGHLVYGVAGTLRAVVFDLDRLEVVGSALPVLEQVVTTPEGAADFDVAHDGTLVYVPGGLQAVARTLVWVDRQGREEPIKAPVRAYTYPRLSPDGTRVALDVRDQGSDIWIWDLARDTLTRFTFDPAQDWNPVWTPDGRRVVFGSGRAGPSNVYWQSADGTRAAERRSSKSEVRPLVQTNFDELNGEVSPDGRWLAYQSNESGQDEIYARPFPDVAGGRWQISTAGGTRPLWARGGQELFYLAPTGAVMSVRLERGASFVAGTPTTLFEGRYYYGSGAIVGRTYDVSPDGRRFLMIKPGGGSEQTVTPSIVVVQNWLEELKRLVPTK